ncbi:hypothetical protein KIF59_17740 [Enterobacter cloacae subsp. cloacae]|nr:hypothetical protein [Enterobacter cloacae subsp. cloacae]
MDKDGLNGLGARGVVFVGDNDQVIFGARAQFIAQTMSTMIGNNKIGTTRLLRLRDVVSG